MAQYDTETLYLASLASNGILLQTVCDALATLVANTGDTEVLELFYKQIMDADPAEIVKPSGKLAAPARQRLAHALFRQQLPQTVATIQAYVQESERLRKSEAN